MFRCSSLEWLAHSAPEFHRSTDSLPLTYLYVCVDNNISAVIRSASEPVQFSGYPIGISFILSGFSDRYRERAQPLHGFHSAMRLSLQAFHAPLGDELSAQGFIAKLI